MSLLLGIGGPAVGLVVLFYSLWRMSQLRRQCDALKARAEAAENAASDIRAALGDEIKHLEAALGVVRTQYQALSVAAEDLARKSPAAASDYLRSMFQIAAGSLPAGEAVHLPAASAAAAVGKSRGRK